MSICFPYTKNLSPSYLKYIEAINVLLVFSRNAEICDPVYRKVQQVSYEADYDNLERDLLAMSPVESNDWIYCRVLNPEG